MKDRRKSMLNYAFLQLVKSEYSSSYAFVGLGFSVGFFFGGGMISPKNIHYGLAHYFLRQYKVDFHKVYLNRLLLKFIFNNIQNRGIWYLHYPVKKLTFN